MKNTFLFLIACTAALTIAGCNSWIDSSVNTDPNNPVDAPINLVLPTAQVSYGYVVGGDISRYTGMFTQHFAGIDRQFDVINRYQLVESDVDNAWQTIYQVALTNMKIVMDKATASNSPHYRGIARVMTAATMGQITDVWGDAPFSDALRGNTGLKPKYDKAEDIYNSMQAMLDSAIADLNATSSVLKPGTSSDVIYGGDLAKWKKAAFALKARYAWRLSKVDGNAGAKALAAIANAFASQDEDALIRYGTDPTAENPLSQFMSQRSGYMVVGPKMVEVMNTMNDPRRAAYIAADKDGKFTSDCDPGPLYASSDSPVALVTYAEMQFIAAEILLQQGNAAGAATAYSNGIKASMKFSGVADADADKYMAQSSVMPSTGLTPERIITEKYIALYTQPETFADWRKTGFPAITPPAGAVGPTPRRFVYAQSERIYNNANMPASITTQSRIFWDK
jgi:hypothetical protein